MTQPELFKDLATEQRPGRLPFPLFPGRFLRIKVAYEDMIFGALGLILLLLGGFCLGVERGKGLTPREPMFEASPGISSTVAQAAARPEPEPAVPPAAPVIPPAVSLPPQQPSSGSKAGSGAYAIQLASYVGIESAREEERRLSRQGISAQVIRQEKYFELRAVGFRSWNEAKEKLPGLRKTYRDAFIKRLTSSGG